MASTRREATFVARLDADDVALPRRLERQVARLRASPQSGGGRLRGHRARRAPGASVALHVMPVGAVDVRWAALFSSPFFHPTVLVERDVARAPLAPLRHELRGERGLRPLVAAPRGRRRRQPRRPARPLPRPSRPGLAAASCAPARVSAAGGARGDRAGRSRSHLRTTWSSRGVSASAEPIARRRGRRGRFRVPRARRCVRAAVGTRRAPACGPRPHARGDRRLRAARARVSPARRCASIPGSRRTCSDGVASVAGRGPAVARRRAGCAGSQVPTPSSPIRVAAVFPEPTPYRAPLLDRVAAQPEIDLTVVYAAGTVAGRTWRVEPKHRAVFLRGLRVPGAQRILHHDYPLTPGVVGVADRGAPVGRRRLGLEHVRRPGRDRLVRDQGRAVRAGRREPRRGAARRVAAHREGHGRAAGRPAVVGRSRHRARSRATR